jgi:hypothetical protein
MNKKEKALIDALKKFYGKDSEKLREMIEQLLEAGDISYGAANEVLDELPQISIQKEKPKNMRARSVYDDGCGGGSGGGGCDSPTPRRSIRGGYSDYSCGGGYLRSSC